MMTIDTQVAQRLVLEENDTGALVDVAKSYRNEGEHLDILPWSHSFIHEGISFYVCHRNLGLGNGDTLDFVISVGANLNPHLQIVPNVEADFLIDITEDITDNDDGTDLTVFHYNREVAAAAGTTPEVSIQLDPTGIAGGAVICQGYIPAGSGGIAVGNVGGERKERIYKRNTKNLIRLTNNSGQARKVSVELNWYEHTPVGTGVT
jgi:hypothetical protein